MCESLNEASLGIQHLLFVPVQSHFPRVFEASTDVPNLSHLRVTSLSQESFGEINRSRSRGVHPCPGSCVFRAPDLEVADADFIRALDGTGEKPSDILDVNRGEEVVLRYNESEYQEQANLDSECTAVCDVMATDDPGEVSASLAALATIPYDGAVGGKVPDDNSVFAVECDGTVVSADASDWSATVVVLWDADVAVFGSSKDDTMTTVAFLVEAEL